MGLESSFDYPSDLNASYPAYNDDPKEGDDHLRGIKNVIKTTLPNVTGPITATQAELNILDGVTATAAELNLVDGSVAGTIVNSKAVVYGSAGEVNATTLKIAGTAITATAAELNYVDGVTSAIQTQLNAKMVFPTTWNSLTGNANATAGQAYYNDTTNEYTLTLPSSPSVGDSVWAVTSSTGNIVVARNGEDILGKASDYTISASNAAVFFIHSGVAAVGWIVLNGAS